MRSILAACLLVGAFLPLLLTPTAVMAKGESIGIYAVIDQVTFDQDGPLPNTVRISGVFVVPVPHSSGQYYEPQRGFLYFRVPPETEQAARKEWGRLKTFAGTGQVVGFAHYWVPNPNDLYGNPRHSLEVSVRTGEDATPPEVYPLPHPDGIVRAGEQSDFDMRIATQLRSIWAD
jgi:hypothetical protein